jgi:excisionase family DNA binding protein
MSDRAPAPPVPPLLNLAGVASRLGVSRTTAWRLVASGEIPSVRVTDTLRRVDPADLEEWIEARRDRGRSAKVVALRREGTVPP